MSDATPDKARVEDRLRAGDRRFSRLERRIDESDAAVKSHLQQQDGKIDEVVSTVAKIQANTQFMVDTWESGARAVRFSVGSPTHGASFRGKSPYPSWRSERLR